MKRKLFILQLFFMLAVITTGFAQNPVSVIDSLDLEIWPDFDKASALVLLTGMLPEDTRRPSPSMRKPIDSRVEKQSRAKFCRDCGEQIDEGDRFCNGCGSEL